MNLTGNIRYRIERRFLRKPRVILQVEFRYWSVSKDPRDLGSDVTVWRDAAPKDLADLFRFDKFSEAIQESLLAAVMT